jgi:hypothetical protein
MLIGLVLAALMFRWGRRVYGLWSGLITLTLVAFSPTIIAYSQLAIGDLAGVTLALAALYRWTRFVHHPTRRRAIVSGILAGLAVIVSFLAIPMIVSLLVMTLWHALRRPRAGLHSIQSLLTPWLALVITLALAGAAWLAVFRANPVSSYFGNLMMLLVFGTGQRGYLLGHFTASGWAYPLLLLVKMTIPELILLALAAVLITMRGIQHREWDFIVPAVIHMLFVTPFLLPSLEIRYLLFVIPLIALFSSRMGAPTLPSISWRRIAASGVIAAAQISVCLGAYPYYLAYFNFIVGGSENGYRIAAGSNLDWGQSLPGLAKYMRDNNISQIYLSYYGAADPADYGIDAVWLRSWPHPAEVEFPPLTPPPGIYAISATDLVGLPDEAFPQPQETFAWFLSHKPMAVIGHSIFIYGVPPDPAGPGTWAAVCASPDPVESTDVLKRLTGVGNLHVFSFDCRQSLAIPQGVGWVVLPSDVEPVVDLGTPDFDARTDAGLSRYRIWKVAQPPAEPPSIIASPRVQLPLPIADHVELLGYEVSGSTIAAGQTLVLKQWWRVRQPPPPPVSLSARLVTIDSSGAQKDVLTGDALGLRAEDWQPGLTLIQQNAFTISSDFAPGDYWLAVGLFDVTTGRHYPVAETADQVIDRIILQKVTITASSR